MIIYIGAAWFRVKQVRLRPSQDGNLWLKGITSGKWWGRWYLSFPERAKLTIGKIRSMCGWEGGSLMLADTDQWRDPDGVCVKSNWFQDFVFLFYLFIYLFNWSPSVRELTLEGRVTPWTVALIESLVALVMSSEVKYLQPHLSPCFGIWLTVGPGSGIPCRKQELRYWILNRTTNA